MAELVDWELSKLTHDFIMGLLQTPLVLSARIQVRGVMNVLGWLPCHVGYRGAVRSLMLMDVYGCIICLCPTLAVALQISGNLGAIHIPG